MSDIVKYFVDPGDGKIFEIDATSNDDAIKKIKRDFRGSGEVRLITSVYRHCYSTPHMVKTNNEVRNETLCVSVGSGFTALLIVPPNAEHERRDTAERRTRDV